MMKKYKMHFSFILFFFTATLMLVVTAVVSVYINRMERTVEESIQNHLLSAALAASAFLTVDELDLFHTIEDMEKPEWESIRVRLQQFAEEHRVLYVSYWRYLGGQTQYIIDNDDDEEEMVTPAWFVDFAEDEVSRETVYTIMAGKSWVSDLGTYSSISTAWGNLITGAAPMYNADGSIYGGAEVDLGDDILMAQRSNIRIMRLVLICSIVLSVISGFLGMWLYRRKAVQSENANRAKTQFLSTMSHEIRTPMNAIIGIAQIELQKDDLPGEYAKALTLIYNSGNGLLGTINDILDMSKIETGKLELSSFEYAVPNLIHDTVQVNIVRIGSRPIEFILDIDENIPSRLIGDELRLKQILNNLLSNAFKYTEKGHVKLSVSHSVQEENIILCFTVEDTGQGMKPEDVAKLFSEYVRFNIESNRMTEGTGIGLNIAKNLVELMEGTIKVESNYGVGSTFTVTVKQEALKYEPIGCEIAERLSSFTFSAEKQYNSLQIDREPMPEGNVLIVDDVETNLYVAERMISPYGLHIETATSGFEAIKKVESGNNYDVIFMDHMMPHMDGIETTQKLRGLGYDGVIIALTANALVGNAEMFKQNGFDDFISKPIDVRHLNAVLQKFIRDKYQGTGNIEPKVRDQGTGTVSVLSSRLLEVFCRDAQKAMLTLRETSADDFKMFTTTAHAMKSALANIGEQKLSDEACALENAGLSGDAGFIADNTESFITSLESLIKTLSSAGNVCVNTGDNNEDIHEDTAYLMEQLQIIKGACEDYNDDMVYSILDLLKKMPWRIKTTEALEKIKDALYLHSDFETAAQLASVLINTLELRRSIEQISGLSAQTGLDNIGGRWDSYEKSLEMTIKEIKKCETKLHAFLDCGDIDNFCIMIHGIKGVLANIGALGLSSLALDLEMAAEKKDTAFCTANLPHFMEGLCSLGSSIAAAFADNAPKHGTLVITPSLSLALETIFNKMIVALNNIDFVAIEEGIENLSAIEADGALVEEIEKIKDAVLIMDYDAAKEVIQNVTKELFKKVSS